MKGAVALLALGVVGVVGPVRTGAAVGRWSANLATTGAATMNIAVARAQTVITAAVSAPAIGVSSVADATALAQPTQRLISADVPATFVAEGAEPLSAAAAGVSAVSGSPAADASALDQITRQRMVTAGEPIDIAAGSAQKVSASAASGPATGGSSATSAPTLGGALVANTTALAGLAQSLVADAPVTFAAAGAQKLSAAASAPASGGSPAADATALDQLAQRLAEGIADAHAEAPVAVWVRAESAELARGFATVLAAELSRRNLAGIPLEAASPLAAEQLARERGARALVRANVTLEHGLLQVRGDLLGTWVNFWSGASPSRPPSPAAALDVAVELDAHALALAAVAMTAPTPVGIADAGTAPLPTGPQRLQLIGAVLARLPSPIAALAAGDADQDGRDELIALTDTEVVVFSGDGRVLARRDHRALPPAPVPTRESVGAVAVTRGPARIACFSARHAEGELLELDRGQRTLRPVGKVDGYPFGAGDAVAYAQRLPGQSTFAPQVVSGATTLAFTGGPFTSLSLFATERGFEALVVSPNGAGALWRSTTPESGPEPWLGLGAGSALADLDGDGHAEVVSSSPLFAPEPDELRVLDRAAKDSVLWRGPVRGRVLQIVAANLDGAKAQQLVLGVALPDGTSELQLYRRANP